MLQENIKLGLSKRSLIFAILSSAYAMSVYVAAALYLETDSMAMARYDGGEFSFLYFIIIGIIFLFLNPYRAIRYKNPSTIFVLIIYYLLLVPAFSVTLARVDMELAQKFNILLISYLSYMIISFRMFPNLQGESKVFVRYKAVLILVLSIWFLFSVLLFYKYNGIMHFSGLEDIYAQRIAGRAENLFWGYTQVYFVYFFSAILLSIGVYRKNIILIFLGVVGFIEMYMVTAERSTLLFPVAIIAIAKTFKKDHTVDRKISIYLFSFTVLISVIVFFSKYSSLISQIGFYLVSRTILTPGQFLGDYYLFFSENGYTYYSHIRGFSSLIDPPSNFSSDPLWPRVGWMIGNYFHGYNSNSNASFWASDGIASLGLIGILIISIGVRLYLTVLKRLGRSFPLQIMLPAMFPLFFSLTNGSFLSMILSYGGGLWLLLLLFNRYVVIKSRRLTGTPKDGQKFMGYSQMLPDSYT